LDSLRKHNVDALRLGMIARVRDDLIEHSTDYKYANYLEALEQDDLRKKARNKKGKWKRSSENIKILTELN
jgi:hypothetical protein